MKRISWLTDIHLEFLGTDEALEFIDKTAASVPDIVLIGGDAGTARNLEFFLSAFDEQMRCPIYFVLGNHDFYNGSIKQIHFHQTQVRQSLQRFDCLLCQLSIPRAARNCSCDFN
ncbi:MAG: metallophosphoesterase [Anaerolineales bacterium]|nr:metallophosphoesterase [Chloroflexota bacterium]MBL6983161.1 metallophosphoesterase [Anaerolineales bacterium]